MHFGLEGALADRPNVVGVALLELWLLELVRERCEGPCMDDELLASLLTIPEKTYRLLLRLALAPNEGPRDRELSFRRAEFFIDEDLVNLN